MWRKEVVIVSLLLQLCNFEVAFPLRNCEYDVGNTKFTVADWSWLVPDGQILYNISFCHEVFNCGGGSICKIDADGSRTSIGKNANAVRALASDHSGFSVSFKGGQKCNMQNYTTDVYFICGKTLGNLEFVGVNGCTYTFEFSTSDACRHKKKVKEIPCTIVDKNRNLRDLSQLIKVKGGHKVAASDVPDFYINVCRELTGEVAPGIHCPVGASSCISGEDRGQIVLSSFLQMVNDYTISLKYGNVSSGCSTSLTFVCPSKVSKIGGHGPILQSTFGCHYEVLWETEHACPVAEQISTTCSIVSRDGTFDLSALKRQPGHFYKAQYIETSTRKKYTFFMNICGNMKNFPCDNNTDVAVCQTMSTSAVSAGKASFMKLRYVDGQLFLTYHHGQTCHNGLRRSTIIVFYCNESAGLGSPIFNQERHCNYFFDWPTNLVCPRARKTGETCHVVNSKNKVYDLTELKKVANESWSAVDGTSSNFDGIYLNVCGALRPSTVTSDCPSDNAACIISGNSKIGLGKFETGLVNDVENSVQLVYTNGTFCDLTNRKRRKSIITFVCHPGQLSTSPTLISKSQDDCQYEFVWKTAAACPLGQVIGDGCQVADPTAGYSFDLTQLSKARPVKGKDYFATRDSGSEYEYQIKVCEGSNKTQCTKDGKRKIGACQYKPSTGMTHMTGEANSNLIYFDGLLKLRYVHGDQCHNGKIRETQITFLCDEKAGVGHPQFEQEITCGIYNFLWYTEFACHSKIVECSATSNKARYDLSKLSTNHRWVAVHGNKRYYISVCKPLFHRPAGCPVDSAACSVQVDYNGVETFQQDLGTIKTSPVVESNGDLVMTYRNGGWCGKNKTMSTLIRFICKIDAGEGSPVLDLDNSDSCNIAFRWETEHACPTETSNTGGKGSCSVQDPVSKYIFNLTSLRRVAGFYRVRNGGDTFVLNICGNVSGAGCNDQSPGVQPAACKLTGVKDNNPVIGVLSQQLKYSEGTITLEYKDGERQDSGYELSTRITFFCNREIGIGSPTFDNFADNVISFKFETSLVCVPDPVQCRIFGPDNALYNLEPLIKTKGYWTALNKESSGRKHHYFMNVCKPMVKRPAACPSGSIAACQVDYNSGKQVGHHIGYVTSQPIKFEVVSIRESYSRQNRNQGHRIGYVTSQPKVKNKTVLIRYSKGEYCHHSKQNRSVQIFFHCSSIEGSPVFLTETKECGYIFNWLTPSACPRINVAGSNCKVEDNVFNHVFDLSDLPEKQVTVNGSKFALRPCGKTKCGDFGACLMSGKATTNIGETNNVLKLSNGDLVVDYKHKRISTKIRFVCHNGDDNLSLTTDIRRRNLQQLQRYEFEWKTQAACLPHYKVECSLFVNGKGQDEMYDLSPLSRWDTNWRALIDTYQVGYPVERKIYINVCRNIVKTKSDDTAGCLHQSGICMIRGSQKLNLGSLSRPPYKEGTDIVLQYTGGDVCAGNQRFSSKIRLVAPDNDAGIGEPVLINANGCFHEFTWTSSVALPINKQRQVPGSNCMVVNPVTGNVIDLTPLKMRPEVQVDDALGGYFIIRVCGTFQNEQLRRKCGATSGACRLKKADPGYKMNAGNFNETVLYNKVLTLKYTNGEKCEKCNCKREVLITFVCAPEEGDGRPILMSSLEECTTVFIWRTKYVCETQVQCTAFGSIKSFDIGRLARINSNIEVVPTGENARYYINVCRGLSFDKQAPCPVGSAACRIVTQSGKRLVENLGEVHSPPQITDGKTVMLRYKNGDFCSIDKIKKWSTQIEFICRYGEKGHPVFKGCDNCICTFKWLTSEVCDEDEEVDETKCTVTDKTLDHQFDLSPLRKPKKENYKVRSSKFPSISYLLNVCGQSFANNENCTMAAVCRLETANGVTVHQSLGSVKYQQLRYDETLKVLLLTYMQDEKGEKTPTTQVTFKCNEVIDKGHPVLITDVQTTSMRFFSFHWQTSLACLPAKVRTIVQFMGKAFDIKKFADRGHNFLTEDKSYQYIVNIFGGIKSEINGCPHTAAACRVSKTADVVDVLALASTQALSSNSTNIIIDFSGGGGPCRNLKFRIVIKCGDNTMLKIVNFDKRRCLYLSSLTSKLICKERNQVPTIVPTTSQKSGPRNLQAVISIIVVSCVLLVFLLLYLRRNPEKRANAASCLRYNAKKYICCKDILTPGYKYRKVQAHSEDSDIEQREGLLIEETDISSEYVYKDNDSEESDTELLQL